METSRTAKRAPAKKRAAPKRKTQAPPPELVEAEPAPAPPVRDYAAIATQFEEDVLAGRFPAGRLFRASIERQRRELAAPPEGFTWKPEIGAQYCRRMEALPFGGAGPERGTPFRLQAWQVWSVVVLFGWRDAVTSAARFRSASLWEPKGNGKSPFAALVALSVLMGGRGGEKVYSAASAQKQARCVFDGAREMLTIDRDTATAGGEESLSEHFGLVVEEHKIKGADDNRSYEPVSSEAGTIEGIRPALVILDEVHVLPNRKLYENLKSACNKVDGSLLITISTAGFDMSPEAIGWSLYCRARDILLGKIEDATTFALIIEADRQRPDGSDADPTDFEVWRQANPNLGVSVSIAGLKSAIQTWRDSPSERPSLETKHLGWWQQGAFQFLDVGMWNRLAVPGLSIDDLDDTWTVFPGIDLARTRDLTAAPVVAAKMRDDGKRDYRVFTKGRVWLPEASPTVKKLGEKEVQRWAAEGWIVLVPGPTMTYAPVKSSVREIGERFGGVEVCVDEWSAAEVEADLEAAGLTVVAVRQGAKTQSEPMKELEAALLDGRLAHDGSPVAAECAGNLQARADRNGNLAPDRENEHKKIDVMVGIINALVRASVAELVTERPRVWSLDD